MSTLKRLHRQAKSRRQGRPAFTLLELIVVLLVLGILAAIAVPTFQRVKENSVVRTAQSTLEAAARNGEAIARSDGDATDEQIAASVESEFADENGLTVSVAGDTVTVTQTSGSLVASGTVEFNGGVATITDAAIAGSGGGSSSTTSTTAAPTTTTTLPAFVPTVGATGPGGGTVFYVDLGGFACGATLSATCTYLEASPLTAIPAAYRYCADGWETPGLNSTFLDVTESAIGTGLKNTTTADSTCTGGAIQQAADYTNNGYADWYLPSYEELVQLRTQASLVGGITNDWYWSSTEIISASFAGRVAVYDLFPDGSIYNESFKNNSNRVRPIRAG